MVSTRAHTHKKTNVFCCFVFFCFSLGPRDSCSYMCRNISDIPKKILSPVDQFQRAGALLLTRVLEYGNRVVWFMSDWWRPVVSYEALGFRDLTVFDHKKQQKLCSLDPQQMEHCWDWKWVAALLRRQLQLNFFLLLLLLFSVIDYFKRQVPGN